MTTSRTALIYANVILIIVCFLFSAAYAEEVNTIWLDELDLSKATCGWGQVNKNKSCQGNPLKINGVEYERGMGTHTPSTLILKLDGKVTRFTAIIGVDDEISEQPTSDRGSIDFKVVGDKKVLYTSGTIRGYQTPEKIDIDLTGVEELRLIADDIENNYYDHADWVMAKFEYTGKPPVTIDIPKPKPYILTPKPKPTPRITGPKVFGARPGNPFLFTVTATGQRPMKFKIKGLPKGLKLDSESGRITGTAKKRGEYKTTVTAQNSLGKAKRELRIVIGDTICLTPPMGWNSWNCWACSVTEKNVRDTAEAMVASGLINHGFSYINIDDCWMRKADSNDAAIGPPVRDETGMLLTNDRFGDMKALTDYIHSLGLKAGVCISPGPTTCAGYVGSWQHEEQDAKYFAEMGFDYLKYDWCGYSKVSGNEKLEDLQRPYILMGQILEESGRDIVYSLCQYGMGNVWEWGEAVGGNCWRTTGDIVDNWGSMSGIGFSQADHWPYAKLGSWNDPDMLVVGKVGWGPNLHDSRLTADEQYTHISLWCLLSAPLLIGCPIEQLDDFTMNLLTNDEVLEVNQDPLGRQAKRIVKTDDVQVWYKDMEDGSKAIGLFNVNDYDEKTIGVKFEDLGLKGESHRVRDLWRQKDLGEFDGLFNAEVPVHGVKLIRVW
ncbi:MAG: NPCBM/NEW2 domain-containing protein [Sedimentisphaerales bacterium]|nr:NPCBM/NEW2 domain-containing protein [Sedimentisphaerales bacterium]